MYEIHQYRSIARNQFPLPIHSIHNETLTELAQAKQKRDSTAMFTFRLFVPLLLFLFIRKHLIEKTNQTQSPVQNETVLSL